MKIVIIGIQGSGKDTLTDALCQKLNFEKLTTGDLYRKEYAEQTDFGLAAYKYWGDGNLCPDEMTNELMSRALSKTTLKNIIFNGYPRTLKQAEYLCAQTYIDLVLELEASESSILARLSNRGRIDDTPEAIKTRIESFKNNNKSIVGLFKSYGIYHTLNTEQPKEAVFEAAKKLIENARSS